MSSSGKPANWKKIWRAEKSFPHRMGSSDESIRWDCFKYNSFIHTMRKIIILFVPVLLTMCSAPEVPEWTPGECRLPTPWTEKVNPDQPWPEYPRPDFMRQEGLSLNGLRSYRITPDAR